MILCAHPMDPLFSLLVLVCWFAASGLRDRFAVLLGAQFGVIRMSQHPRRRAVPVGGTADTARRKCL